MVWGTYRLRKHTALQSGKNGPNKSAPECPDECGGGGGSTFSILKGGFPYMGGGWLLGNRFQNTDIVKERGDLTHPKTFWWNSHGVFRISSSLPQAVDPRSRRHRRLQRGLEARLTGCNDGDEPVMMTKMMVMIMMTKMMVMIMRTKLHQIEVKTIATNSIFYPCHSSPISFRHFVAVCHNCH